MIQFTKQVIRKDKTHDLQTFKIIRSFGRKTYNGIIALNDAFEVQVNLKDKIDKFINSTIPKFEMKKGKISDLWKGK